MVTEISIQNQFLGADVCKATISFFCPKDDKVSLVKNTKKTLRSFLRPRKDQTLVVEATGGYEAKAIEVASVLGMHIYRVNPFRVRSFMNASGQYAKTDDLDAKALSAFARQYEHTLRKYVLPSANQKTLQQFISRREDLVSMRTQETNRFKAPDNKSIKKEIRKHVDFLKKQIKSIEQEIEALVENDEELLAKKKVMVEITGVGEVTANTLVTSMPELGTVSRKQIASLAGLAPFAKDSGVKSGYRRVNKGRQRIRQSLFLAALSASRYSNKLKPFYDRLISNGKKPMVALIAVARKLITILNAKVRDALYTSVAPASS